MKGARRDDGAGRARRRGQAGALDRVGTLEATGDPVQALVHILSPFDPLIIQRKRTELFFGYGHRFEAYVPKEKRLLRLFRIAGSGG